jgi:glycosyltransferase involved in cell wall biosynthesis
VQSASRRLAAELRRRRIDLIHFNDFIDVPFFPVARTVGIPAVSHLRLIVSNPLARTAFQIQARRGKTLVLPVSRAVERAMLGDGPIPRLQLYDPRPDPLLFHPSGAAEMDQRKKLRAVWGWKQEDFVLILVSKLLENKGHLNFLRVAQELERRSPGSCRFLMVAGPSPGRENYEAQVREAAEQLPSGSLRWVPGAPHREIAGLLRASDCFLHLPDTEDSLPSVVLEAMACGVPVVAHRLGGIPEELDEGRAGVLVPQGDVEGAAEQVETLRKEEGIRRQVVEQALGRIETLFSEEAHFAALGEVYERLGRT